MFKVYDTVENKIVNNDNISINKNGKFFLNGLELSGERYAVSWNLFIKDSKNKNLYSGDIVEIKIDNKTFTGYMSITPSGNACIIAGDIAIPIVDSLLHIEKIGNVYENSCKNNVNEIEELLSWYIG